MRPSVLLASLLLAIASCGSPPKPPSADGSTRRPANSLAGIELQSCRSDLHNTRILANETTRFAEVASANATRLALRQQADESRGAAATAAAAASQGNAVYTVLFAFGSAQMNFSEAAATTLAEQARSAAVVMLRGRTDGSAESAAETRIARERALAVHALLVQAGVDASRIRTTWQPIGDHASDNATTSGRDLNRRVEIELYRATPRAIALAGAKAP